MPDKKIKRDYTFKNLVVFTQQIEFGKSNQFLDVYEELVDYAEANNLTKPKKQELLTAVFKAALPLITPENFFK